MIYFIIGIIFFNFLALYIIKNFNNYLKYSSIITIIAGYLTIAANYFLKYFIEQEITTISISKITTLIYSKIINRGLVLILIGGTTLVIYIILNYIENYKRQLKNINSKKQKKSVIKKIDFQKP